jgi:hypothetical protein
VQVSRVDGDLTVQGSSRRVILVSSRGEGANCRLQDIGHAPDGVLARSMGGAFWDAGLRRGAGANPSTSRNPSGVRHRAAGATPA